MFLWSSFTKPVFPNLSLISLRLPRMVAKNQESKAFAKGSEAPKIDNSGLTVFSMRFCPFAERVRLTLNKKNIPYDVININLKNKPEWYLERNPLGKVPCIEEPDQKKGPIFESLICAEYLDDKYPDNKLLPEDPYERARQKMMIEVIGQKFGGAQMYGLVQKGDPEMVENSKKGLDEVEKMLTTKYFAGDKMGFVDLMVWPFFERIEALNRLRKMDITKERYPKLLAWIDAMLSDPAVKETAYSADVHAKFMETEMNGKGDVDIGL